MLRFFGIVLISIFPFQGISQNPTLDSLRQSLSEYPGKDSIYVKTMIELGMEFLVIDSDSSFQYLSQALNQAKEINFKKGLSDAYRGLGYYYYYSSDMDNAIKSFEDFYRSSKERGDWKDARTALSNIGVMYELSGNYVEAIKYQYRSLNHESPKEDLGLDQLAYGNIGLIYSQLNNPSKAIEYYEKSLEIEREIDDKSISSTLGNMAVSYRKLGDTERALELTDEGLLLDSLNQETYHMGILYQLKGMIYMDLENYNRAISFFKKGLENVREVKHSPTTGEIFRKLGEAYTGLKAYNKALISIDSSLFYYKKINSKLGVLKTELVRLKALQMMGMHAEVVKSGIMVLESAKELRANQELYEVAEILYKSSAALGYYANALEYSLIYKAYSDSLNNTKQIEEIANIEVENALNRMEVQNQVLIKENELIQAEVDKNALKIQQQNLIIYGGIALMLLLIGYAVTIYRSYQSRKKAMDILKSKNDEILAQSKVLAAQSEELMTINEQIKQMNETLEEQVQKRTEKIQAQNERFKEYAFSNAHLVRAPLARILGIVQQLQSNDSLGDEERDILNGSILSSAEELDQVIRKVSEVLSSDADESKVGSESV